MLNLLYFYISKWFEYFFPCCQYDQCIPVTVWFPELLTLIIAVSVLIDLSYNCEFSFTFWKDLEEYLGHLGYNIFLSNTDIANFDF